MRECLYISGNEEGWRAEETDNMDMRLGRQSRGIRIVGSYS